MPCRLATYLLKVVVGDCSFDFIFAKTDDLLTWATGWVTAEDRHLLLDEARGATRIAALDVPGVNAFSLVTSLRTFVPSAQAESIVSRQTSVLKHAGRKGREILRNIDLFVKGVSSTAFGMYR